MDLDGIKAKIREHLGFRSDLDSQIFAAVQKAQEEMEGPHRTLPDFLKMEDQTFPVVAASQTVALPARFLKEVEGEGPHRIDSTYGWVELTKRPYWENEKLYSLELQGAPAAYSIRSASIKIWPIPSESFTYYWSYYQGDTVLGGTGTETNLWLTNLPYLIIGRAGKTVAELARDKGAPTTGYEAFARMQNEWEAIMLAKIAGAEDANMPRQMGANQ